MSESEQDEVIECKYCKAKVLRSYYAEHLKRSDTWCFACSKVVEFCDICGKRLTRENAEHFEETDSGKVSHFCEVPCGLECWEYGYKSGQGGTILYDGGSKD